MNGSFQTSREIFEHPIWKNVVEFRLFFLIYGNAVFKSEGTTLAGIHIKRGQWIRSYRNLQKDMEYIENRSVKNYSLSRIKRAVDSLVKQNRIEVEECELGTLFSVVNYETYQGFDRFKKDNLERRENAERTETEQGWNNNKNVNKDLNVKNDLKDPAATTGDMPARNEYNFYTTFQRAFGRVPTPIQSQDICNYIDEDGLEEELICYGLEKTAKAGKDYGYAARIFGKWKSKGIFTYDQALKEQEEFELNKRASPQFKQNKSVKKDKLPPWIEDQEKRERENRMPQQPEDNNQDEGRKKRIKSLLIALGESDEEEDGVKNEGRSSYAIKKTSVN
jgi:DnaD/phage-associated family protein